MSESSNVSMDEYVKDAGGPFYKFMALHNDEFNFVKDLSNTNGCAEVESKFLEQNVIDFHDHQRM